MRHNLSDMPTDTSNNTQIVIHRQPKAQGKVAVFGIVRNEMYLLPHLLEHYRRLDVKDFWFHDDQSDDGTFEFLMRQPDVGVTRSQTRFGDKVDDKIFGYRVKNIIPRGLLRNRWVATLDADEFMVLPPGIDTLPQLALALERNNLIVARALMMDFFPQTLESLRSARMEQTPFELCPFFDPWERLVWPDNMFNVTGISVADGVRPRILKELLDRRTRFPEFMKDYKFANVNKTPIAFWNEGMHAFSAHRTSVAPSDKVQLILAHFKFYPGHEARTDEAVVAGVHWKSASEYHILKAANEQLMTWPLQGPRTQRFTGKDDLAKTGLLYSRLE
ncbi:hypothetical protein GHT07_09200 [Caenimonas koreensis DSM 17982]|uniref:Glycosyl transferase family 2 n=2 Tax=Caenimonas TaxID=763439 RepID=A0A844B2F9_9BURK|nr:hypothetical protein [Caenimonas koreensis DSM 17982]